MINKAPHGWLDANCRMRPDGLYFDSAGNLYRPATEDDAQYGHNDTWPGDPIPVPRRPELRHTVGDILMSFHRNSCHPDALSFEVEAAINDILAAVSAR